MFSSDEYLSETDKIDRIYSMLRAERRGRRVRFFIKLCLIGGVVYGYYYLSLPANAPVREKIMSTAQAKMMEFILPLVGDMVQDLTQNMLIPPGTSSSVPNTKKNTPASSGVALPPGITPEMMQAVQDAMKK